MNRAVAVGPQYANSRCCQSFEQLGTWVSIWICLSDRDDANLRRYFAKEFGSRGIFASVMANFQDIRVQNIGAAFCDNLVLRLFFRISGQHDASRPVTEP